MFAYQPTFDTINVKEVNHEYNVIAQRSKGVYTWILSPSQNWLPVMKNFDYKTWLQFNNSFLVVEKYYSYKTVNVYDLDYWPIKPLSNFILQNSFFGATNIAKGNNKSKYMYSSYGGAFDGAGSCRFGN